MGHPAILFSCVWDATQAFNTTSPILTFSGTLNTHLGELGKIRNLQSPSLVIGQMEMELVELVHGHEVEKFDHVFLGMEVPGHVQMHAPILKPGSVLDERVIQNTAIVFNQIQQRLNAVEDSRLAVALDDDDLIGCVHIEAVGIPAMSDDVTSDMDIFHEEADDLVLGCWSSDLYVGFF